MDKRSLMDEPDLIKEFHDLLKESKQDDERESRKINAVYERTFWFIVPDTRKVSQVIDNKPKFIVRKVIR
jgi:hypothetical protein